MATVRGFTWPGWHEVQNVFLDNFAMWEETGASLNVIFNGNVVVDIWYGDSSNGMMWTRDYQTNITQASQLVYALCLLVLHDKGLLQIDQPVNVCWPDVPLQDANLKISELIQGGCDTEGHSLQWYMKGLIEITLQKESKNLQNFLEDVLISLDMENQLCLKANGDLFATGRCVATFLSSLQNAVSGRKSELFSVGSVSLLQQHLQTLKLGDSCLGFARPTLNFRFGSTDNAIGVLSPTCVAFTDLDADLVFVYTTNCKGPMPHADPREFLVRGTVYKLLFCEHAIIRDQVPDSSLQQLLDCDAWVLQEYFDFMTGVEKTPSSQCTDADIQSEAKSNSAGTMQRVTTTSTVDRSKSLRRMTTVASTLPMARLRGPLKKSSGGCEDCNALREACPRCADWRKALLRDTDEHPDILRGVSSVAVTKNFGKVWRTGNITDPKDARITYGKSFQVKQLSRFLSHSWHAHRVTKVVCLFVYFNSTLAEIAGWLAMAVYFWCLRRGLGPTNLPWKRDACRWVSSFAGMSEHVEIYDVDDHRPILLFVYVISYYGVFMWGQIIRWVVTRRGCLKRYRSAVFLDKMCIHQTDMEKKQRGINAIGAYLIQSAGVTILWDPTYFTRLWCVFEVAVFRRLNPTGVLEFKPLKLGRTIFFLHLMLCVWACVQWTSSFVPQSFIQGFTDLWYVLMFWFLWQAFGQHFAELEKMDHMLKNFSAKKANCFSELDRVFVNKTIRALYGSLEEFDQQVREVLHPEIQKMSTGLTAEVALLFKMLSPYIIQQYACEFATVIITPGISDGMLLVFAFALFMRVVGEAALHWAWVRTWTYVFRHQRCYLGFLCMLILLMHLSIYVVLVEGAIDVLFSTNTHNFRNKARANMNYCDLTMVKHYDMVLLAAEPVERLVAEQECIGGMREWYCKISDMFGFVLPTALFMYLLSCSLSSKTSDFEEEESPFSIDEFGEAKMEKALDTV